MVDIRKFISSEKFRFALLCISIIVWLSSLFCTDFFYSIYVLVAVFGFYGLRFKSSRSTHSRLNILWLIASVILSLLVSLGNFTNFFVDKNNYYGLFELVSCFMSGSVVFYYSCFSLNRIFIPITQDTSKCNARLSILLPILMFACYSIILIITSFPGVLTGDSIDEIGQIVRGSYNNHHPVFYTWLIAAFVRVASVFGFSINVGVFLFCLFQIAALSFAVWYSLAVLMRYGVKRKYLIFLFALTLLMPFNINYSFTVWKDVLFGVACLLFISSSFSFLKNCASKKTLFLVVVSAFCVCALRSNGFYAFFVFCCLVPFWLFKNFKPYCICIFFALILSTIFRGPFLSALHIKSADAIESLSIPTQQMSRAIVEHGESFSDSDLRLIEDIVPIDIVRDNYNPTIHDPVKNAIRLYGNQNVLNEKRFAYVSLYFRIGLKYPVSYLRGWIDQTRGYYGGGFLSTRGANGILENDYGLNQYGGFSFIKSLYGKYDSLFNKLYLLQPFVGIGIFVWLLIYCLFRCIERKKTIESLLCLFLVLIWGTLVIATPVFCEFRYIYYLFVSLPFVLTVSLAKRKIRDSE